MDREMGASQAVTAIYERHALGLTRLAFLMLGDRQMAEDVVQEAFCGLYRAWDGREWLVVPKGKVIEMSTPDRGTHLCETYGKVFCFITGDPQS